MVASEGRRVLVVFACGVAALHAAAVPRVLAAQDGPAVTCASPVNPQQEPPADCPVPGVVDGVTTPEHALSQLDAVIASLGATVMDPPPDPFGPDFRGRRLHDDFVDYVGIREKHAQLRALRDAIEAAVRQRDADAGKLAVTSFRKVLEDLAVRGQQVIGYWSQWGDHPPDRSRNVELLRRHGLVPAHDAEILELEGRLRAQVRARDFPAAVGETLPALRRLYFDA